MQDILWLIFSLPLAGFVVLALAGERLGRKAVGAVGVGSVLAAATISAVLGVDLMGRAGGTGAVLHQTLWTWMSAGDFQVDLGLRLDSLSVVMTLVVTVVGTLIHLYSVRFMSGEEEGYARFFAYLNLFVAAMLLLVLADNLLLLYMGWEGVGLCSYLLIGYWYRDPANGRAARKAFVITRIGDAALAIGLFVLFWQFGTLQIDAILQAAPAQWAPGSTLAVVAALMILGGAVGKSAQLPLQTWLPDAMAGPTPVSALIHAATMVTAGVYLIARTHTLFELAPAVMTLVAIIGALTLLVAGMSALVQNDIKRVLAYSTISQIGYMFLALGVGAWSAAIFHLMTHAFFKALLFLGAGVIIHALDGEHDIFEMGGLKDRMPLTFWTFLVASLALTGFPLVTAGFYSKDLILWRAWSQPGGSAWLWAAGAAGVLLTGLYIFRVVFRVFFGDRTTEPTERAGGPMAIALVVLAVLSVIGGFVEIPETLGGFHAFGGFVGETLPHAAAHAESAGSELVFQAIAALLALGGIALAWAAFLWRPAFAEGLLERPVGRAAYAFFASGWGFDWLYQRLIVRPYMWLARINRSDYFDAIFETIAGAVRDTHYMLRASQTGRLRTYLAVVTAGAVLLLAGVIWL